MSKVKIGYQLSEKGRKASLLAGGDGKADQVIEADITPELLERASVSSDGNARWGVGHVFDSAQIEGVYNFASYRSDMNDSQYSCHKPHTNKKMAQAYFDEAQTPESLLTFVKEKEAVMAARVAELEELLPEKITLWEKAVAEHKEKAEAAARAEAEREARQKAEKERLAQEKADWIDAHGSDYLQRAAALGYDCQRQYVTERATQELPGFIVDIDDRAHWKSRACPSEEALELVENLIEADHSAECVWLTKSPEPAELDEDGYPVEFEECEAVVVQSYLGKYDLVRII